MAQLPDNYNTGWYSTYNQYYPYHTYPGQVLMANPPPTDNGMWFSPSKLEEIATVNMEESELNAEAQEFVPIYPSNLNLSLPQQPPVTSHTTFHNTYAPPISQQPIASAATPPTASTDELSQEDFNDNELELLENEMLESHKKNFFKAHATQKICSYFQQGTCKYDYACRFRHVNVSFRDSDDSSSPSNEQKSERGNDHSMDISDTVSDDNGSRTACHMNVKDSCATLTCILCEQRVHEYELLSLHMDVEDTRPIGSQDHLHKCTELKRIRKEVEEGKSHSCAICLDPCFTSRREKCCLLSDCSHVFHMTCIKKWKEVREYQIECPLCRKTSEAFIPCDRYISDPSRKKEHFERLKKHWSLRPCKYWQKHKTCPWGPKCYFAHFDSSGQIIPKSESYKHPIPPFISRLQRRNRELMELQILEVQYALEALDEFRTEVLELLSESAARTSAQSQGNSAQTSNSYNVVANMLFDDDNGTESAEENSEESEDEDADMDDFLLSFNFLF